MLPVNLLNALNALTLDAKQLPQAEGPQSTQAQFQAGQRLQGVVQTQVTPGVFNVRVADQLIQMQLPAFIRSGDTIKLQVIATSPRLSFSMSASTNPLSTPESVGSVARLLSALSQQPPQQAFIKAAHSTPLWTATQTPAVAQLAGLLREALGNSGLFYESHQAQWLDGARSTSQLMLEPQNHPPARTPAGAQTPPGQSPTPPPGEKPLNIPEHLQPLVQQQLNALETRQVLWQGNIWPNQLMQWEIRDQEHQQSVPDEEQQQWATQIRLDLPRLGPVTATLRFSPAGLSLTLDAENAATRTLFGKTCSHLSATLTDNGIPVISTLIAREGSPHESAR